MLKAPSVNSGQPSCAACRRRIKAAILASSPASAGSPRKCLKRIYSAGIETSASSSKTKCPSGRCVGQQRLRRPGDRRFDLGELRIRRGDHLRCRRPCFPPGRPFLHRVTRGHDPYRPPDGRTGSPLRSSRAGRSPSNRPRETDWHRPFRCRDGAHFLQPSRRKSPAFP